MWGCGGKAAEEAHNKHLKGRESERQKRLKVGCLVMCGDENFEMDRGNEIVVVLLICVLPDRWTKR